MGSLQTRLFLSYFLVIVVTLGLFAISLFFLLGGFRDSITYASLEDIVGILNKQVDDEVSNPEDLIDTTESPNPREPAVSDLMLALRSFLSDEEGDIGRSTSLAVVNADGDVIDGGYASAFNLEGVNVGNLDAPDSANLARTIDRCELDTVDEERLLCVSVPLSAQFHEAFPESGAVSLVVAKPAASISEVLDDLLPRLSFAALIGLTAALVLAIGFSRSVAAPLRNISRAARNVARGNYQQRVPATGTPEVRALAADFNRMTEEVQRSEQTLRDFLMNISHELKTPLTSIRGFSDAMVDGTIDDAEGIEHSARVINDESRRVLRLVSELLDLSRIESGQISMEMERLDLDELLTHMRDVFTIRGEEAGVSFTVLPSTAPPVQGDFDRLEQVLNNLLDNAFRYTPKGGYIELSAEQMDAGRIDVTVRNSGPGIPEDDLPNLFDRFYRAGDRRNQGQGYGLGLAISREIIRAHGGHIWATSVEEDETTFVFTLPAADRVIGGRRAR
jgi:signal transduction histidine kinase